MLGVTAEDIRTLVGGVCDQFTTWDVGTLVTSRCTVVLERSNYKNNEAAFQIFLGFLVRNSCKVLLEEPTRRGGAEVLGG